MRRLRAPDAQVLQRGWGSIVTAQRLFYSGVGVRVAHAVIASARRPSTSYGFWGTKIIGGGIIVRQRHTYPNSELCAARNTLAIMFFCCYGAVAERDLTGIQFCRDIVSIG